MTKNYLSPEAERARRLYGGIMEEIKRRQKAMTDLLTGTVPPQPQIIVSEFCYLQLRFICEPIIIGCAVAHGDIEEVESRRFQKEWNAARLANYLSKIHPEFYPRPTRQILGSDGKVERIENVTDGFLTLDELKELYDEAGSRLHAGSAQSFRLGKRPEVDLKRIANWTGRIRRLLNHHCIQLIDPSFQIWTLMQAKGDGRVHINLFKKLPN